MSVDAIIINEALKAAQNWVEKNRVREIKWKEEKEGWLNKIRELEERVAVLEKERETKGQEAATQTEGKEGEKAQTGVQKGEGGAIRRNEGEMTEEKWALEIRERCENATKAVISAMGNETETEHVTEAIVKVLGGKWRPEGLEERKGSDGLTRWIYKFETVGEREEFSREKARLQEEDRLTINPASTYIERRTKAIITRRMEKEKAAGRGKVVEIAGKWIRIGEKWERWSEKEERWVSKEE